MTRLSSIIRENADLTACNTFGVKARARYAADIYRTEDLQELISTGFLAQNRYLILGGGSNVLFRQDFDGIVLRCLIDGIEVTPGSDDEVLVHSGAGVGWHRLVTHCVDENIGGIENLALIPGTAGAAPVQNIGAYGAELGEVLSYVETIDLASGNKGRISAEGCHFGYRDSIFKHNSGKFFFISSITLRLTKTRHHLRTSYAGLSSYFDQIGRPPQSIRDVFDAVVSIRRQKLPDPAVTGNAGSFFKNPVINAAQFSSLSERYPGMPFYNTENQCVKIPAGWLIERAGWKGKRIGNAGVHERQALVLVNHGGASGQEIIDLSLHIQHDVKEKFNIDLQREVQVVE